MSSLFEAYITNLGKYNEGRLVGETLKFPATTEEVQSLLKRIGVDGVRYEEIFITSFDGDVLGLYDHLGEYESIDELNHLAHVLVVCGSISTESMKNDVAVAQRRGITATTLDGILTVKRQGRR